VIDVDPEAFKSIIYHNGEKLIPIYITASMEGLCVITSKGKLIVGVYPVLRQQFPPTKFYNINYDGKIREKTPEYVHIPVLGRSRDEQDEVFITEMVQTHPTRSFKADFDFDGQLGSVTTSIFVDSTQGLTYNLMKRSYVDKALIPIGIGSMISIVDDLSKNGFEVLRNDFENGIRHMCFGRGTTILRTSCLLKEDDDALNKIQLVNVVPNLPDVAVIDSILPMATINVSVKAVASRDLDSLVSRFNSRGEPGVEYSADKVEHQLIKMIESECMTKMQFSDFIMNLMHKVDFEVNDIPQSDRAKTIALAKSMEAKLNSVPGSGMLDRIGNYSSDFEELVVLTILWKNRNFLSHSGPRNHWLFINYDDFDWTKIFGHEPYGHMSYVMNCFKEFTRISFPPKSLFPIPKLFITIGLVVFQGSSYNSVGGQVDWNVPLVIYNPLIYGENKLIGVVDKNYLSKLLSQLGDDPGALDYYVRDLETLGYIIDYGDSVEFLPNYVRYDFLRVYLHNKIKSRGGFVSAGFLVHQFMSEFENYNMDVVTNALSTMVEEGLVCVTEVEGKSLYYL